MVGAVVGARSLGHRRADGHFVRVRPRRSMRLPRRSHHRAVRRRRLSPRVVAAVVGRTGERIRRSVSGVQAGRNTVPGRSPGICRQARPVGLGSVLLASPDALRRRRRFSAAKPGPCGPTAQPRPRDAPCLPRCRVRRGARPRAGPGGGKYAATAADASRVAPEHTCHRGEFTNPAGRTAPADDPRSLDQTSRCPLDDSQSASSVVTLRACSCTISGTRSRVLRCSPWNGLIPATSLRTPNRLQKASVSPAS